MINWQQPQNTVHFVLAFILPENWSHFMLDLIS